jgi:2-methylcitrate dehydratase PrpD
MSYSGELSRFIVSLRFSDLPNSVIDSAKRHLMDIVGVGLVGSRQHVARCSVDGFRSIPGSARTSRIWGREERLSAPYAAMANGLAAHVLDFDDTHTDSITHGSAVLGPVVLALGEELKLSGPEIIAAFVAGWEVTARVGLAARGSFHKRGFHTTSIAGIFGATAAAGKLLGLSFQQMCHALGLTGSQVSGVSEYLSNGSSSKSFHPGWAAFSGIVASYLAKSGMTGPMTVFEGRYGLFKTYGILEETDLTQLTADLGKRWEVERISIKPYPCCHFAHAFIDCAKALRKQGVTPEQVEQLECVVPEIEVPLICEPIAQKLSPETPYAAKFSLPFLVAAALTEGVIDHDTFDVEKIKQDNLLALAGRLTYRVAKPGETTFPTYFPGWIKGHLKGRKTVEERLDINYGNPDNPLRQKDIENKFLDNSRDVIPKEHAHAFIRDIGVFEQKQVVEILQWV